MTNVVHLETNKDYKAAAECLHYSLQTAQKGAEKYPFILIYRHVTKSLEEKLQQFSQMCLDLLRSSLRLDEKGIMSCNSSIEHCQALLEASWIAQGNLLSLVEALTPNLFQCTLKFQENQLTMVASNLPEPIENNALEFYNFLTMLLPPTVRKPLGTLFHKHVRNNYLKDWYLPLLPTDDLTPFLDRVRQFDIVDKTALTLDLLNDSMPSLSMSMDFKAFMQQKRRNQALNITRQLWFSSNLKEVIYSPPAWSTSNAAPSSVSSMELPSPFTLLDPKLVLEHPFPMHLQTISATMAEFLNVLQQYKDDPVPLLQSYLMYLNLFPTMVPRSSMLHFVDTMVLIDACKHWFMLQPNPSVAILIPLLMETVKKIYQQQLTHQKGLFFECFQPALTELTYLEKNGIEKVQLYLQRIQHLIKQLKSAIEDILPPPFFHHFLGTLMDAMLTSLLTELLSWEDITVTESELLYQCWKPFLNTISLPLRDFIPSFHTVHSLIDVLSSSLKEIQSRLQNHHYIHCSARHLQHFIHALFQESDARKSLLKEIKEGVQGGLIQI
ncbi:Centromere/kinetochore protein zw10 [Coelomomyces lativittatus]|nr:Centromere/kinetochore protein zw10 [Coelomomyces lativittatus]